MGGPGVLVLEVLEVELGFEGDGGRGGGLRLTFEMTVKEGAKAQIHWPQDVWKRKKRIVIRKV